MRGSWSLNSRKCSAFSAEWRLLLALAVYARRAIKTQRSRRPRAPPRRLPDSYEALAEALDRLAHEAEADDAAAPADRGDRVCGHEPAAAQETGADGERVGHVR